MRNFADKSRRENRNTQFYVQNIFFSKNHGIYEIILKKYGTVIQDTDDNKM